MDPWLSPFKDSLRSRYSKAQKWIKTIDDTEGGLEHFSRGYEQYGFHVHENGDVTYQEWAPNAKQAYLIGEFSTLPGILPFHINLLHQMIGIVRAFQ